MLKNQILQQELQSKGYVVLSNLLPEEAILDLRTFYFDEYVRENVVVDFAKNLGYHITVFCTCGIIRQEADKKIRAVVSEPLSRCVTDYRLFYSNFMCKEPLRGEIDAHQDFTSVDEDAFSAYNLWIPLEDSDIENGCFHLIEGSHLWVRSFRGPAIRDNLTMMNETLRSYMVPLRLKMGEGVIFDHRLFHWSPTNRSNQTRIAIQSVLVPKEAITVFAYYNPSYKADCVELKSLSTDDALSNNLWTDDLSHLTTVETKQYAPIDYSIIDSRLSSINKRPLFRTEELQERFNSQGHVIIDLLNDSETELLENYFYNKLRPVKHSALYESSRNNSEELNAESNLLIESTMAASARRFFQHSKFFGGTYMAKPAGSMNYMSLHQDWSIVEEDKFDTYFIWCALQDVNKDNGGLFVLPGSHKYFKNRRSGSLPAPRIDNAKINRLTLDISLNKGQAIVYSDKLFHGSYPNITGTNRLVATGRVVDDRASLVYYHKLSDDEIGVYSVDREFYLNKINVIVNGELPDGMTPYYIEKHHSLSITEELLLKRMAKDPLYEKYFALWNEG